jgi:lipopolysaccharide transport system ATP-binding protein
VSVPVPRYPETPGPEEKPGKADILVVDDFFPKLTTGFRVAEYTHYLRVFPDILVASTIGDFKERHSIFAASYPDLQSRVVAFDRAMLSRVKLGYFNFINNAYYHIEDLEDASLPFAFTLYPGGGFGLHNDESDRKLRRVLGSPMLRAVISTQSITSEVLRQKACPAPVHELFGATVDPTYLYPTGRTKNAGSCDSKLMICFVAHKYDLTGRTKGYPTFIEVAAKLVERRSSIEFSVVGNYGPDDLHIPEQLRDRLHFKGLLTTGQLREFLYTQDLMISPNRPYAVTGSTFDGFPTACSIEASLCGVAILCSDEFGLNHFYSSDEMIVCAPETSAIVAAIEPLLDNVATIANIGARGRQKSRILFSAESQLLPRTKILRDLVSAEGF